MDAEVSEEYSFNDIVNIEELRHLFEAYTEFTGFTIGLIEQSTGQVLISAG